MWACFLQASCGTHDMGWSETYQSTSFRTCAGCQDDAFLFRQHFHRSVTTPMRPAPPPALAVPRTQNKDLQQGRQRCHHLQMRLSCGPPGTLARPLPHPPIPVMRNCFDHTQSVYTTLIIVRCWAPVKRILTFVDFSCTHCSIFMHGQGLTPCNRLVSPLCSASFCGRRQFLKRALWAQHPSQSVQSRQAFKSSTRCLIATGGSDDEDDEPKQKPTPSGRTPSQSSASSALGLNPDLERPVPSEQRPVNELAALRETWLYSWVS